MKCAVAFFLLLVVAACGGGVVLGDSPTPVVPKPSSASRPSATLLEDLVRMTRAGSSEAEVLAYARAHRLELPPELSEAALLWLRDSGVRESVVRYMSAIDVRPSHEKLPEGVTEASAANDAARRRFALSVRDGRRNAADVRDNDSEGYARGNGSADDDFSADADSGDDSLTPIRTRTRPLVTRTRPSRRNSSSSAAALSGDFRIGIEGPTCPIAAATTMRGGSEAHAAVEPAFGPSGREARAAPLLRVPSGNFGQGPRGPRQRSVGSRGFGPSGPGRGGTASGFRGTRGAMGGGVGGGHTGSGHPTGRPSALTGIGSVRKP